MSNVLRYRLWPAVAPKTGSLALVGLEAASVTLIVDGCIAVNSRSYEEHSVARLYERLDILYKAICSGL